jgi:hypothetical protein
MKVSIISMRLLAVTILCLPFFTVAWLFSLYFLHYGLRSENILSQRQTLGRLEALITRADEIDRLIELQNTAETNKFFFTAASTSLVVAQIQQRLQAIIAAQQAHFIRATEIPRSERRGISFTGVRLELSGHVESLARSVDAIESAVPLLFIEKARFTGDPLNSIDPDRQTSLVLSLDILGAMLTASAAAGSRAVTK